MTKNDFAVQTYFKTIDRKIKKTVLCLNS